MRWLRWFACLVLVGQATLADTPVADIIAPTTVAPNTDFIVDARRSISDRPLRWKYSGGRDVPAAWRFDQGGRGSVLLVVPSGPAGTIHNFKLTAQGTPTGSNELEADAATWSVVVSGAAPVPPAPNPVPPGPTPDPVPPAPTPIVTGKLWAIYCADASAPVLELRRQTDMKQVPAIDSAAPSLDLNYRWTQSNTTDVQMASWIAEAKKSDGIGLPCVFIVTQAGKEVAHLKDPDEATILTEVKRLRGVKP